MKRFIFLHYIQCDAQCQYYFQKNFKNFEKDFNRGRRLCLCVRSST